MKKILLTSIALAGLGVSAFGQGQIEFLDADNVNADITLNSGSGPSAGSGLVVELLWQNPSSQFIVEDTFTSTFTGGGTPQNGPGYFTASPVTCTIPAAGTETFEVEGFYTSNGIEYSGTSATFTAIVRASPTPATSDDTAGNSSWNGSVVLTAVPEPATIALGGLGAAALLLFRRRK